MNRAQLEHIIRASAVTADVTDIVVIGSQSILGTYLEPPQELTQSMEADVFPLNDPQRSVIIDGAIGELSPFFETFGYYGHGVDENTASLPDGWRDRLVRLDTPGTMGAIGWCLEPNDLAVSKLAAGREKDLEYIRAMLRYDCMELDTVIERLQSTSSLSPEQRQLAKARLDRLANA